MYMYLQMEHLPKSHLQYILCTMYIQLLHEQEYVYVKSNIHLMHPKYK